MATVWKNWGRTQVCRPAAIMRPSSESGIRTLLTEATRLSRRVKVVGSGHSFTDIACTDGLMLSLERCNRVLEVDAAAGLVTVQAGITLRRLNEELASRGLALENLGDIAYQTIAGAISTATHGTGLRYGNLSTQVRALRLLTAQGDVVACSPTDDPETFRAAQVSLGALGVISTVTLACVPAFNLKALEEAADLEDVLASLDEHVESNQHFEFFWFPHTSRVYTKQNNRSDEPLRPKRPVKSFMNDVVVANGVFGVLCRLGKANPKWIPPIAGRVGDTLGRVRVTDRSDRVFASPRYVRFSEMEYAIPREQAVEAVLRLRELIDERGFRVNFPVEVRFVAADDIFLSPSRGRDTCYIAVHLYRGMDYEPYFRAVEEIMCSYHGRPHWGKLHFREAGTLRHDYPDWDRFVAVRSRLDPQGTFRNPYLDRVLGLPGAEG